MIQTYIFNHIHPVEGHFHKTKAFKFKAIILSNMEQNMQDQHLLGNKNSTKAKGKEQSMYYLFFAHVSRYWYVKFNVANYFCVSWTCQQIPRKRHFSIVHTLNHNQNHTSDSLPQVFGIFS